MSRSRFAPSALSSSSMPARLRCEKSYFLLAASFAARPFAPP
eukprot:CAMPEP_0185411034 /NCGR_PEP_ID=MMETSP1365-20130426/3372_1 /TAXON_ID=38817 /ORGANISM="Gephyrocapsa oceanica, Strain RCC1303" /LENGTH=41 /DNA_ID= /DNA_START= /DNA_END= /DNA_ORIENTATION=